ncbi:MAG TPA: hypothetical protein DDX54_03090 [Rhodospirillaceae bacterium]|nr:hypothetical protein [Rhodospirillaceae bacterium]
MRYATGQAKEAQRLACGALQTSAEALAAKSYGAPRYTRLQVAKAFYPNGTDLFGQAAGHLLSHATGQAGLALNVALAWGDVRRDGAPGIGAADRQRIAEMAAETLQDDFPGITARGVERLAARPVEDQVHASFTRRERTLGDRVGTRHAAEEARANGRTTEAHAAVGDGRAEAILDALARDDMTLEERLALIAQYEEFMAARAEPQFADLLGTPRPIRVDRFALGLPEAEAPEAACKPPEPTATGLAFPLTMRL